MPVGLFVPFSPRSPSILESGGDQAGEDKLDAGGVVVVVRMGCCRQKRRTNEQGG